MTQTPSTPVLTELPVLSAIEQRILGALLEKQVTVPASYPLSLNALAGACNQTSSRDPVSQYADDELEPVLRDLKTRELVRVVWAGRGARTLKYHQRLDERLQLSPAHRALLTVLLLRGPQAPGELRTRTERLHRFADRQQVAEELGAMAAGDVPMVRELPRRAGQQDARWVHRLGPEPEPAAGSAPVVDAPDREVVLAQGAAARDAAVRSSYDAAAVAYADALADELTGKPFDRWLLDRIGHGAAGPVLDVGCGPGQVAAHLRDTGAQVSGMDLSPGMVEVARAAYPDIDFTTGNLFSLLRPSDAPGWGALVCWYSLVHLAPSEFPAALAAMTRVLDEDGVLALALHIGTEVQHAEDLFGKAVNLDFVRHDPHAVRAAITGAGLVVREWYVRGPWPGEAQTERLYLLAGRPPRPA